MKTLFKTTITVILLMITINAFSQQVPVTSTIQAKATVIDHIKVINSRDLNFGNDIIAGVTYTVDKTSNNSGKFNITGQKNREISILFSLPSVLVSNTNTLPIIFNSTDAGFVTNSGQPYTSFNPSTGTTTSFSGQGEMEIVLGGTITPSATQEPGYYKAPVTITLQYTIN